MRHAARFGVGQGAMFSVRHGARFAVAQGHPKVQELVF